MANSNPYCITHVKIYLRVFRHFGNSLKSESVTRMKLLWLLVICNQLLMACSLEIKLSPRSG